MSVMLLNQFNIYQPTVNVISYTLGHTNVIRDYLDFIFFELNKFLLAKYISEIYLYDWLIVGDYGIT